MKSFFEPHYRGSGSGIPTFMALLSVAQTFTKGGYLRSIAEIEHYLITIAAAVLPPGAVFKQFVFSIVSQDIAVATPTPASDTLGKRKRQGDRESSTSEQLSSQKATKHGRKCAWEGCDNTYKNLSALRKHEVQHHTKPPPIRCGECDYDSRRRDRVRAHFLKQHPGIVLPESLRLKGKRGVIPV
ncbi:hypothetical protein B0T18DRAFT_60059 [Schizothecium vesticola]|uniref:C2H2-type domain-containing protein n=1 Tax=Schizothecium vesticola TaxID=314040 RepID=A0AA40K9F2_9PEZI|nr:hypothetical protein B0T18DRAFT_60059 [Schizothecium vesticola]